METKPSPELQEMLAQVEKALIQAAQNARKLAEQTGTPLVVRPPEIPQPLVEESPTASR